MTRPRWFLQPRGTRFLEFSITFIPLSNKFESLCLRLTAIGRSPRAEEARGGRREEEKSRRPSGALHRAAERFALTRVTQSPAGLAPISRVSLEFVPRKKEERNSRTVGQTGREIEREREREIEMTPRERKSRVESRRDQRTRFCVCCQRDVTKPATRCHAMYRQFF